MARWGEQSLERYPLYFFRILLIIGTYILGEVGFFPFGSTFRFGLGSVFYVLVLYTMPQLRNLENASRTGLTVVLMRAFFLHMLHLVNIWQAILNNASAFLYYFALTVGLMLPRFRAQRENPLATSIYLMSFDFLANVLELQFTDKIFSHFDLYSISILVVGALFKGICFLAIIATKESFRQRLLRLKEKEKFCSELMLGSNLYAESYFLKKIMQDIERVTEKSFYLYKKMENETEGKLEILQLAEQIHEIKKDTQRVSAGLLTLIKPKETGIMDLQDILELIKETQTHYAMSINKNITWHFSKNRLNSSISNYFPLLVILNNILANAIEAIKGTGEIAIIYHINKGRLFIHIGNTGDPIPAVNQKLIFLPGYTTKFSSTGISSTGIGLTHVQNVLTDLFGNICISSTLREPTWTWFHVEIPLQSLRG